VKPKKRVKTTFRLDARLWGLIVSIAKTEGVTRSTAIERVIADGLKARSMLEADWVGEEYRGGKSEKQT
jgi:hypothetical protein